MEIEHEWRRHRRQYGDGDWGWGWQFILISIFIAKTVSERPTVVTISGLDTKAEVHNIQGSIQCTQFLRHLSFITDAAAVATWEAGSLTPVCKTGTLATPAVSVALNNWITTATAGDHTQTNRLHSVRHTVQCTTLREFFSVGQP